MTFKQYLTEGINEIPTDPEKPKIFSYTIYRLPTDKELDEFINFPNMTPKEIYNGFGYTMIGKGILDKRIKKMITDSIQLLINKFPDDNRYKEALKLAENREIK